MTADGPALRAPRCGGAWRASSARRTLAPGPGVVAGRAGDREQGAEVVLQLRIAAAGSRRRASGLRLPAPHCGRLVAHRAPASGPRASDLEHWDWREAADGARGAAGEIRAAAHSAGRRARRGGELAGRERRLRCRIGHDRRSTRTMAISLTPVGGRARPQFPGEARHGVGLRLGVKKTGCSGLRLRRQLRRRRRRPRRGLRAPGVKVIVDAESLRCRRHRGRFRQPGPERGVQVPQSRTSRASAAAARASTSNCPSRLNFFAG